MIGMPQERAAGKAYAQAISPSASRTGLGTALEPRRANIPGMLQGHLLGPCEDEPHKTKVRRATATLMKSRRKTAHEGLGGAPPARLRLEGERLQIWEMRKQLEGHRDDNEARHPQIQEARLQMNEPRPQSEYARAPGSRRPACRSKTCALNAAENHTTAPATRRQRSARPSGGRVSSASWASIKRQEGAQPPRSSDQSAQVRRAAA